MEKKLVKGGGSKTNKSRRQREAAQNAEMGQDLITNLPPELLMNILSRLPVGAAMSCKCASKLFLDLLTTSEFVKSHLSNSVSGLVVFESGTLARPYKVYEFVDELDHNRSVRDWEVVFNFNLPYDVPVHSSVNGMIFLCIRDFNPYPDLIICNPVTRESIMPPCPLNSSSGGNYQMDTYGFGVSISGQYKVVRVYCEYNIEPPRWDDLYISGCQVYTVGIGTWRKIPPSSLRMYELDRSEGAFLNGNLHWAVMVRDPKDLFIRVSCFDLETEVFSTFSLPEVRGYFPRDSLYFHLAEAQGCRTLSVLGSCICICTQTSHEIGIWLMKEYGVEESWTKQYVIRKMNFSGFDFNSFLWPVKVFKNGDILMESGRYSKLAYYSNQNKTIQQVYEHQEDSDNRCCALIYTPTFLQLKTFPMENVIPF